MDFLFIRVQPYVTQRRVVHGLFTVFVHGLFAFYNRDINFLTRESLVGGRSRAKFGPSPKFRAPN
jgi:hypothetical protein